MSDTIYRDDAIEKMELFRNSLNKDSPQYKCMRIAFDRCIIELGRLPSAQQDDRLNKIAELVDGTIHHFDRDDAMDILYQIKEVLK